MRRQVATYIRSIAEKSPQDFEQMQLRLNEIVTKLYHVLGNVEFGVFKKSFRVPADADTEGIQTYFDDGVLRVALPRTRRQYTRPMPARPSYGRRAERQM